MITKTIADLEKEINKGCHREFSKNDSLYEVCQAKQDLLKEVKKIIANEIDDFVDNLKDIEIWDCSPDEYLDRMNQEKRKLKSKLGILETENG